MVEYQLPKLRVAGSNPVSRSKMMIRKADLHIHTNFSDGSFTPEEIIKKVYKLNISTISFTDHDSIKAIEQSFKIAHKYSIEIISGVELTSYHNDLEIHILGYFIEWNNKELKENLENFAQKRISRIKKMIEKLKHFDIYLDFNQIAHLEKKGGTLGRLHLAQLLVEKGHVQSIPEAFAKYLGENNLVYEKKYDLSPSDIIELITKFGGIPILAHPYLLEENLILSLIKIGIKGIEVFYPQHSDIKTNYYLELAKKYNFLVTGGSDFHGEAKKNCILGKTYLPYNYVEVLKNSKDIYK